MNIYEQELLSINYGKGNFNVDLNQFLPKVSQKNFKMVLDMVDLAADCSDLVNRVYDYIVDCLNEQTLAEFCCYWRIKADSLKKKLISLKDILVNRYNLAEATEAEQTEKRPRCKSAIIYTTHHYGEPVQRHFGFTFEKAGFKFTIHNAKDHRGYIVSLYGVQVTANNKSKPTAIDSITDEIISLLNSKPETLTQIKETYTRYMVEAGYMTADEAAAITAQVEPEKTAPVVSETVEAIPATKRTIPVTVAAIIDRAAAYMTRRNAQKAQWVDSGSAIVAMRHLLVWNIPKSAITAYYSICSGNFKRITDRETIKPLFSSASYQGRIMLGSGLSPPILKSAIDFELKCCSL